MKVALQPGQFVEAPDDIRRLGLDFLYANTIRTMLAHPRFKPLGRGGSDAVEIEAG
jgi:hypothetical protein